MIGQKSHILVKKTLFYQYLSVKERMLFFNPCLQMGCIFVQDLASFKFSLTSNWIFHHQRAKMQWLSHVRLVHETFCFITYACRDWEPSLSSSKKSKPFLSRHEKSRICPKKCANLPSTFYLNVLSYLFLGFQFLFNLSSIFVFLLFMTTWASKSNMR